MYDSARQLECPVGKRLRQHVEQQDDHQSERIVAQCDDDHIDGEGHATMHNARPVVDFQPIYRPVRPSAVAQLRDTIPCNSAQRIGQQIVDIELPVRARVEAQQTAQLGQFDHQ